MLDNNQENTEDQNNETPIVNEVVPAEVVKVEPEITEEVAEEVVEAVVEKTSCPLK